MFKIPGLHIRPVVNLVLSVVVDQVVLNKVLINSSRLDELRVLLDLLLSL